MKGAARFVAGAAIGAQGSDIGVNLALYFLNNAYRVYDDDSVLTADLLGGTYKVGGNMSLASRAFSDVISLSRAGAGSYWSQGGVLSQAAANAPRFDYHPITRELVGLNCEEQRTNLTLYSDAFDNAAWSKFFANVTPNSAIAPDGTQAADFLYEDTTASTSHYVAATANAAFASGGVAAVSVYARAGQRSFLRLEISNSTGSTTYVGARFDLGNGQVVGSDVFAAAGASGVSASITPVGNGWYRCAAAAKLPAVSSCRMNCRIVPDATTFSSTGDGVSGLYVWGAQMEAGADASSYIPTIGSQVTRTADVIKLADLSWFNPAAGTFEVEYYRTRGIASGKVPTFLSVDDGTFNNRLQLRSIVAGYPAARSVTAGAGEIDMQITGFNDTGTITRVALAYQAGDVAMSVNGALSATSSTYTPMTAGAVTEVSLGSAINDNWVNAHIRNVKYWPYRRDNATIMADTSKASAGASLSMDFFAESYSMGIQ